MTGNKLTLVIFQKINDYIFISADMKLEWHQDTTRLTNVNKWRPKVIIIKKDLVISWAGELVFAQEALKQVWNNRHEINFEKLKKIAIKYHNTSIESGEITDFIIADSSGNSCKISDRNCYELAGNCFDYIGDRDLFQNFLKATHTDIPIENRFVLKIFGISDELDSNCPNNLFLINSKLINTSEIYSEKNELGHVTTPVTGSPKKGFTYNMHLLIDTEYVPPNGPKKWETIDLGSIEKGSYSYQINKLHDSGHEILVYENLHNKEKYFFGDFRNGVPEFNKDRLILPT